MLSSDKNVESIAQLITALKDYIGLQKEYLKFDVIDKLVRLVTALTFAVIAFVLVIAVLFYLSFAAVYWMEPLTGTAFAFAIVAAFFLLLLVLVSIKREAWIEKPLVKFLVNLLIND
jgi:hypothetical protein